jgi:SAM-dependent methyltransferase
MSEQFNQICRELESWYDSGQGTYALEQLRAVLASKLETAFGYHILQLGPVRGHSLLAASPINHRIHAGERGGAGVGLVCEADEIPLDSDSVDVIVAHHCIEFSANPHQVLRELQRVLTPQGHLLLVGFNPMSLRGLATMARRLNRHSPWRKYQPVSEGRVTDWLRLVGCTPESRHFVYALPPLGGGRLRDALERGDRWLCRHNLPIGGLYVVHAIKQVAGVHAPRLRLRRRSERLIGLAVPKAGPAASPAPKVHRIGSSRAGANGDSAA